MNKDPKQYEVFKDIIPVIYEAGKPVIAIIKHNGHDIFFDLKEMRGDKILDTLQTMTGQIDKVPSGYAPSISGRFNKKLEDDVEKADLLIKLHKQPKK